ncbi:MAG: hypothetical protein RLZZ369_2514 [Pseudomonadota bacterium]|jgi:transcriptional regulator NrdR family protein
MRKRRPKPYPWLKVPRTLARRKIKKHGHNWTTKQLPFAYVRFASVYRSFEDSDKFKTLVHGMRR